MSGGDICGGKCCLLYTSDAADEDASPEEIKSRPVELG